MIGSAVVLNHQSSFSSISSVDILLWVVCMPKCCPLWACCEGITDAAYCQILYCKFHSVVMETKTEMPCITSFWQRINHWTEMPCWFGRVVWNQSLKTVNLLSCTFFRLILNVKDKFLLIVKDEVLCHELMWWGVIATSFHHILMVNDNLTIGLYQSTLYKYKTV